jgi:inosine-uridine nucleoside N-ribohydrolase
MAGQAIPVAEGAQVPLVQPPNKPSDFVHGAHGLGEATVPDPKASADPRPAHQFIADTLAERPGEIVLVAVGPLTNLALALQHHPEITKTVKHVVVMGGAVRTAGNVTKHAEANIWNDPHAADAVFSADWPVTLVGLDVTETIRCTPEEFAPMRETSPKCGALMNEAAAFYFGFHIQQHGVNACFLHDPAAVIAALEPSLFDTDAVPLSVICEGEEIGNTVEGMATDRRAVNVCIAADIDAVKTRFLRHLRSGVLP